jgi:hypothetical protein
LDKWYTTPPSNQNAATVYQQAVDLFAQPKPGPGRRERGRLRPENNEQEPIDPIRLMLAGELPLASESLPNEVRQAITEVVTQNTGALKLLHEGAGMSTCRYPIERSQGTVRLPHLRDLRYGVSLLTLEMLLAAERGDSASAVESAVAGFGVARSLENEPYAISQLVRWRCQMIINKNVERVLGRLDLTPDKIAELESVMIQAENPNGLMRAYVAERCSMLEYQMQYLKAMSRSISFWPTWQEVRDRSWRELCDFPVERIRAYQYGASGVAELDVLAALEIRNAYIQASRLPYPDRINAVRAISEQEKHYTDGGSSFMYMPASVMITINQARCVSQLRAARGALVLERTRLAEGKLPDQVETILPTDPFTGRSLKFKKVANGYVVYGVGADGVDDGGDEKKDITFRVLR